MPLVEPSIPLTVTEVASSSDSDNDRLPNGMSEPQIVLAVQKLGLNAPRLDNDISGDWVGWWDATASLLSDEQFAEIWNIFSGFRLFEVAEVEVG